MKMFLTLVLVFLLIGCESIDEMQKKVEQNEKIIQQNNTLPNDTITNTETSNEPVLQPEIQEDKNNTPTEQTENNTPIEQPSSPTPSETPTTPSSPSETPITVPPTAPTQTAQPTNSCGGLSKLLCELQDMCEFAVDLKTGKQYCRQRCKAYSIIACSSIESCLVKSDRRNQSVCITNCDIFTNSDLCGRYADCGWREGNCTTLGIR